MVVSSYRKADQGPETLRFKPSPFPSLIFQFCQNAGGLVDSMDMARISSEFEKREERRTSMTTQTITINNNCNTNKNNKDIPNQGLFPVESSDKKHRSRCSWRKAGAALHCAQCALCSKVHCAQCVLHKHCVPKFTVHKLLFTVHNHRKLLFIVNRLLWSCLPS